METDLLPNIRGNVKSLRNMWATKVQEEQKLLKPRSQCASIDETIVRKEPTVKFDNKGTINQIESTQILFFF
jgi:hypothetical protein